MNDVEISVLLTDYTEWLLKHCYVDDDVWCEEPTAVSRYMEKIKNEEGEK